VVCIRYVILNTLYNISLLQLFFFLHEGIFISTDCSATNALVQFFHECRNSIPVDTGLLHSYRFTNSHVYFIIMESVAFLVASVAQQILTRRVAKIRFSRTVFKFVLGQILSSSSWISTRPFSKSAPFSDILHPRSAHTVHFYQLVVNSERENHVIHTKPNNIWTCIWRSCDRVS
jgi:hypothetical protein